MDRLNDTALLIGRLLMASLFLVAGVPKVLQGYGGGFAQYLGSQGVPYPEIVGVIAVAIEVLVPVALILGLWPRISALLLIAFVVVATGLAHRFWEFPAEQLQTQMSSFLKNIAIVGGLLFYYFSGPGAWSLAGRSADAGAAQPVRA
jgi:putative oxidoreductase